MSWGFGGGMYHEAQKEFESIVREGFDAKTNPKDSVYEMFPDMLEEGYVIPWKKWRDVIPAFNFSKSASYFELFVHTIDTVRYSEILRYNTLSFHSTFMTGVTGAGKTAIAQFMLEKLQARDSDRLQPA